MTFLDYEDDPRALPAWQYLAMQLGAWKRKLRRWLVERALARQER